MVVPMYGSEYAAYCCSARAVVVLSGVGVLARVRALPVVAVLVGIRVLGGRGVVQVRVVGGVLGLRLLRGLGVGVDAVLPGVVGQRLRLVDRGPARGSGAARLVLVRAVVRHLQVRHLQRGLPVGVPVAPDRRRRLSPGLPPMAQPVEKPRRNESVTYVWPVANAIVPTAMTNTDGISTPTTTQVKPPKASRRQRRRALYCSSTSPSSHNATMPNAM